MTIWVVVKTTVPCWIPIIRRHLIFRVPKQEPCFLTTTHIEGYTNILLLLPNWDTAKVGAIARMGDS